MLMQHSASRPLQPAARRVKRRGNRLRSSAPSGRRRRRRLLRRSSAINQRKRSPLTSTAPREVLPLEAPRKIKGSAQGIQKQVHGGHPRASLVAETHLPDVNTELQNSEASKL